MSEPAPAFDVFLSYNSQDRAAVLQLAEALKARGLRVWLDDWEMAPGSLAQNALEQGIRDSGAAAVVVGPSGLGPWEEQEMLACIALAVKRKMRVIPLILPEVPVAPELPLLLANFKWLRLGAALDDDSLSRLEWGIRAVATKLEAQELPVAEQVPKLPLASRRLLPKLASPPKDFLPASAMHGPASLSNPGTSPPTSPKPGGGSPLPSRERGQG